MSNRINVAFGDCGHAVAIWRRRIGDRVMVIGINARNIIVEIIMCAQQKLVHCNSCNSSLLNGYVHRCSSGTENLIILFMIIIQCAVCYRWRWRHYVPAVRAAFALTRSFHRFIVIRRLSISSRTWHLSVSLACIWWVCVFVWVRLSAGARLRPFAPALLWLVCRCVASSILSALSSLHLFILCWERVKEIAVGFYFFRSYSALAWCAFYTRW